MKKNPVNGALKKIFGSHLYGGPKYRVVWSEDRHEITYGQKRKKYGEGKNRWILETYCPPDKYGSRETWESARDEETNELVLGPFPSEGDYEHSFTFEVDGQGFNPPEDLAILVCRCIEAGKMSTQTQRWAAIKEAQEKAERERKRKFDDIWDDSKPAVHAKIPDHIAMLDSIPQKSSISMDDLHQWKRDLPRKGFSQISAPENK
jgi:hypothetical protein